MAKKTLQDTNITANIKKFLLKTTLTAVIFSAGALAATPVAFNRGKDSALAEMITQNLILGIQNKEMRDEAFKRTGVGFNRFYDIKRMEIVTGDATTIIKGTPKNGKMMDALRGKGEVKVSMITHDQDTDVRLKDAFKKGAMLKSLPQAMGMAVLRRVERFMGAAEATVKFDMDKKLKMTQHGLAFQAEVKTSQAGFEEQQEAMNNVLPGNTKAPTIAKIEEVQPNLNSLFKNGKVNVPANKPTVPSKKKVSKKKNTTHTLAFR